LDVIERKRSGKLLEFASANCPRAELSFSDPTRDANRVIESSWMKSRPLATDYDATTLIAGEVGRARRSELIESPDCSDRDGDVLVETSQ
jgi:hypothetical protein